MVLMPMPMLMPSRSRQVHGCTPAQSPTLIQTAPWQSAGDNGTRLLSPEYARGHCWDALASFAPLLGGEQRVSSSACQNDAPPRLMYTDMRHLILITPQIQGYNDGDFEGNVPTDLVRPQQAARRAAAAAKKAIEVQASKEAAKRDAEDSATREKKTAAKDKKEGKTAKAAARALKAEQKAAAQAEKAAQKAAVDKVARAAATGGVDGTCCPFIRRCMHPRLLNAPARL